MVYYAQVVTVDEACVSKYTFKRKRLNFKEKQKLKQQT